MGWICLKCGNKNLFKEINEFETKVYQKDDTRIVLTSDKPLGTGAIKVECFKCKSHNVKWTETKKEKYEKEQKEFIEYLKNNFKCQENCARCCKYSIIPLTEDEIKSIETHTGLDKEVFSTNSNLMRFVDGKCYFLKDDKCTIYKARPNICKQFPFGRNKISNLTIYYFCKGLSPFLKDYKRYIKEKLSAL